ncbi:hypothetical protein C7271_08865 [filamentous cyanobacterium CCP5]|nr:hypothetical protein C7271_08865 [filamentous cyanobacterium CCP5]
MNTRSLPLIALAGLATSGLLCGVTAAQAAPSIQLSDRNASFFWNLEAEAFEDDWIVDGLDSLFSQKVFFGISSQSALATPSDFDLLSVEQVSDRQAKVSLLGFDNQLQVDILAELTGFASGSGKSYLSESYTLTNRSDSRQTFSFFYYQDYDMGGPASFFDDFTMVKENRVAQFDLNSPAGIACVENLGANQPCDFPDADPGSAGSVMVTSEQTPDSFDVGPYPSLLAQLFSDPPQSLNRTASLFNGDGTVALQFDRTLEAAIGSTTFRFEKTLHIPAQEPSQEVPEPSLGLALLGLGGYLWKRWRR